jgi:ribosomal protein S2
LIYSPHDLFGKKESVIDELREREVGLVVSDPAREQHCVPEASSMYVPSGILYAGIDAQPRFLYD